MVTRSYSNGDKYESVTIRWPEATYQALKAAAYVTGKPLNTIVVEAVDGYLTKTPEGQKRLMSANSIVSASSPTVEFGDSSSGTGRTDESFTLRYGSALAAIAGTPETPEEEKNDVQS